MKVKPFNNLTIQQFNHFSINSGFTLIELLIAVTLLGIIASISTQAFILGFRSQGKSEALKEVKQNGDYALSIMESMIRNATDISSAVSTKLTITNRDGYTTTFDCSDGIKIASISGISQLTPAPTPTGIPLTTDKVIVSSCNFRVVSPDPPIYPKYVYIAYTLTRGGGGITPTPGAFTSLDYQSTVSLRNY